MNYDQQLLDGVFFTIDEKAPRKRTEGGGPPVPSLIIAMFAYVHLLLSNCWRLGGTTSTCNTGMPWTLVYNSSSYQCM